MNKTWGTVLVFIFLCFSLLPISAFASENAKASQSWRCMKGGSSSFNLTWHDPPSPSTLTQNLSGSGLPDGRDIYLVGCLPANNTVCSSGDRAVDNRLFGTDNTAKALVAFSGGAIHRSSRAKLDATATVAGVNMVGSGGYSFYAITINDPLVDNEKTAGAGGQQQNTFAYELLGGDLTNCVSISWTHHDPYGIVFDSQSLEPIPGVNITILDQNKKNISLVGFPNPQTTQADGLFNFLVEPGTYYLAINPVPPHYTFSDNPKLHPNYAKLYHKDNGDSSLYSPNKAIVEIIDTPEEEAQNMPFPERRDIPLDPGNNPPLISEPVLMNYGAIRGEKITEIRGKTSHPLTQIILSQSGVEIANKYADREGFFYFQIDNFLIEQDQPLGLSLKKTVLTNNINDLVSLYKETSHDAYISTTFLNIVNSINTMVRSTAPLTLTVQAAPIPKIAAYVYPILATVKGYAYAPDNTITPNALVKLQMDMSEQPFAEGTADNNGYFEINPVNTPSFNYHILIQNPTTLAINSLTTSQFATLNHKYLTQNSINLMNKKSSQTALSSRIIDPLGFSHPDIASGSQQSSSIQTKRSPPFQSHTGAVDKTSPSNQNIPPANAAQNLPVILIIILIFLFIGILLLVVFYIKRERPTF